MLPLGIFCWFVYDLPLEKRLKLIAEAGFSSTCLWFDKEEPMVRDGQADEMPGLVRQCGLTLDNIHAPFWKSNYLWSESTSEKSVIHEELSNALSYCGKHKIPNMVMHLSAGKTPPPPNQSGLQLIGDLVKQAEDLGVTIAMENAEDYGNHYLDFVFTNIQSPNLRFCYDSSHDAIANEFRGQALEKWGSLLAVTHFSDNHGVNDDHVLPGYGSIDWQRVMKQFPKGSYKGTIMLEVDGPEANKGFTVEGFLDTAYLKARELAEMAENV
jgi:sugar phosphate isomerase/epimerase